MAGLSRPCPFQCSTKVWPVLVGDVAEAPTAQAREEDRAATAFSQLKAVLPVPPGFGLGTRTHLVPFQRVIRVRAVTPDLADSPTAQALAGDVAATPSNRLPALNPDGFGLACCFQAVPFQCRTSVLDTVELP